ncbi:MAG: response regulator [Anaerolineae bacterium]|nr:response regulator [Anaerolineae bacterium]
MRILYVEDTLLNLCLIERIARMGNHEVINYVYAEQALENFERDQPDLVLVDLRLEGEMSGVELIERLRAAGYTQPIIVITAQAGDDVMERCQAAGCTEFYNKPLMVREMVRLLHRYAQDKPFDHFSSVG